MKPHLSFLLIASLSFFIGITAEAKTPDNGKVIKVLAIGNSFSQNAVEQNLFEIAASDGITLIIGNMYIAGCSLERHVNNLRSDKPAYSYRKIGTDGIKVTTRNTSLATALADEDWDYVSVQESSPLSGIYEGYEANLPELVSYVRERVGKHTKIMFHQTWAYSPTSTHKGFKRYNNDQMTMYNAICTAVRKACRLVGIKMIIPSGTAIQNARTTVLGNDLTRDGYHLSAPLGQYIAAATWYEKIFRRSVVSNGFCPDGISEEELAIAQKAARAAVRRPFGVSKIVF